MFAVKLPYITYIFKKKIQTFDIIIIIMKRTFFSYEFCEIHTHTHNDVLYRDSILQF